MSKDWESAHGSYYGLPKKEGVYIIIQIGSGDYLDMSYSTPVYIGSSSNLSRRLSNHPIIHTLNHFKVAYRVKYKQ